MFTTSWEVPLGDVHRGHHAHVCILVVEQQFDANAARLVLCQVPGEPCVSQSKLVRAGYIDGPVQPHCVY